MIPARAPRPFHRLNEPTKSAHVSRHSTSLPRTSASFGGSTRTGSTHRRRSWRTAGKARREVRDFALRAGGAYAALGQPGYRSLGGLLD